LLVPKLEHGQILERLRARLDELKQGKDVAARELRALLTSEQVAAMDSAWAEQQELRKAKRARTKEEEEALGWKSKRDIHIEAYERALAEAESGKLEETRRKLREVEVRRSRIYLDSYFEALAEHYGNRDQP
jgi:soluble cytochrome b562